MQLAISPAGAFSVRFLLALSFTTIAWADGPPYGAVQAILNERCVDCHAAGDAENNLVLESLEDLAKGGKSGAAILANDSEKSLLVRMIEGREGVKIMPPGKRKKLSKEEIALIRAWIDAGALGPKSSESTKPNLTRIPEVVPTVPPRNPVFALDYSTSSRRIAAGRYQTVDLIVPRGQDPGETLPKMLEGAIGNVNKLLFSADGSMLFGASGEQSRSGQILQWETRSGKLIRNIRAHNDAINALALSPDGNLLATGGYDQKIKLWNLATGQETRTLQGHNGAVFGLSFRKDGKVLASASGDSTIKLWDVATGQRLDTLSQPQKEQYAVAFHPNGQVLYAAGVDNRIRFWRISETAQEGSNTIIDAKFGHEGAILALAFSPDGKQLISTADDGTAKIWDATSMTAKVLLEKQPDWPVAAVFLAEAKTLAIGRLDGSLEQYKVDSGEVARPPKPELARVEPRGLSSGLTQKAKLIGKNLTGLSQVKFSHPGLSATWANPSGSDQATIEITAKAELPRGSYTLSVLTPGGESQAIRLFVDDLPSVAEENGRFAETAILPAVFWGNFMSAGEDDEIAFNAKRGQILILDCAARSLGSKAMPVLSVRDPQGQLLASDHGQTAIHDPLFVLRVPADGRYVARLSESLLGASSEHFYRLAIGEFAFVSAFHPLAVPVKQDSMISLIGYNLQGKDCLFVKADARGDLSLALDPKVYRWRSELKVLATTTPERLETEPNNNAKSAQKLDIGESVSGQFHAAESAADEDFYRFACKAGQRLILETTAQKRGSSADTKIEVLWTDGSPVEQVVLQAVRDSSIEFRPEDSDETGIRLLHWEEMTLDQYLYAQGEVMKTFRMPQGPDSDMIFYSREGKRRGYFGTTPTSHALNEAVYVVQPHPPGTKLVANGLPVFPIHYRNDDAEDRDKGADSRLLFTAPKDGEYLLHVSDNRGFQGEDFVYRATVREAAPDFRARLSPRDPEVAQGSGRAFSISAERIDGFEGEIHVAITSLPNGFTVSSPLTIQVNQSEAQGTIFAARDATAPSEAAWTAVKVTAWAEIDGHKVEHEVENFGKIRLGSTPPLRVALLRSKEPSDQPEEITISPGTTVSAWLRLERNGHDDLVTFSVNNLPHGVIVDNIGLSGVLIPKGENEREIFLTAYDWVPETERPCFALSNQAGNQTSAPALLKVIKAKTASQP